MSITEELKQRAAEKPDAYTLAWWNSQFQEVLQSNRGLKHALHLALANNEDLGKSVKVLQEQVKTLEADHELDRAKIGEQKERIDRQGKFLDTLKQKK